MPNLEAIIKRHNNKVLSEGHHATPSTCNCRDKDQCPLPGKCTMENVVYEATVTTSNEKKSYIGLSAPSFKARYGNHKQSFEYRSKSHHTELSKYIWHLKDTNKQYTLEWAIKKQARPYSATSGKCNLCSWEKYYIITANKKTTLNSRSELTSTCRHMNGFLDEIEDENELEDEIG